jgi:hypothetical protein
MRCLTVLALGLALFSAPVWGQATRPAAPEGWSKAMDGLARAVAESDAGALAQALGDEATIQSFEGRSGDALHLLARLHKGSLVVVRTYVGAPDTMASDVSDQVQQAQVPEDVKQRMLTGDERQARRANAIAAQWVSEILSAKADSLVGVVVFWCDHADDGGEPEMVFVLVRGEAGEGGTKVKAITYGDPLRQAK